MADEQDRGREENSERENESNSESTSLENEVTDPIEELARLKNEYLYLRAEFDNFRKQSIRERSELLKYGAERFARELLEVVDNFDRALEGELHSDNLESFKKGIDLTAQDLRKLLERFGVQEVPTQGEAFDPNLHEALSSEETSEYPPGHVSRTFKKAYKIHDKLLRPAQVVVAAEPKSSSTGGENSDSE